MDDGDLIAEAQWMVLQGLSKSLNEAFTAVAQMQTGRKRADTKSIVERLRRKNARQKNSST